MLISWSFRSVTTCMYFSLQYNILPIHETWSHCTWKWYSSFINNDAKKVQNILCGDQRSIQQAGLSERSRASEDIPSVYRSTNLELENSSRTRSSSRIPDTCAVWDTNHPIDVFQQRRLYTQLWEPYCDRGKQKYIYFYDHWAVRVLRKLLEVDDLILESTD